MPNDNATASLEALRSYAAASKHATPLNADPIHPDHPKGCKRSCCATQHHLVVLDVSFSDAAPIAVFPEALSGGYQEASKHALQLAIALRRSGQGMQCVRHVGLKTAMRVPNPRMATR